MKLDSLIEEAYNVFSHYTISSRLDVCKVCCITDEEEKILTRTPLAYAAYKNIDTGFHT